MFNARSEGITSKQLWKDALKSCRVVVPAAYYDAHGKGKDAQRFAFQDEHEQLLPLAGLWSWWRPNEEAD